MEGYVWLAPLVAFVVAATGWLLRELHFRRGAKRQAARDASKTLSDKKALLEDVISKTEDEESKQVLLAELEEVNAALLGLYGERLRRTLNEAGLPPEKTLIADGRSKLQPQEVSRLREVIAEINALPPSMSYKDFFVLSTAYYHMQQYEDAKNILNQALNLNPDNPVMLNNRGVTYNRLEKYNEALVDFNRSLEIRPDNADTLCNRGLSYAKLGKYDDARADFNHSLEIRPDHPDTITNRGNTYYEQGRYDEALADFNRSLEIRPDHPATLNNQGSAYTVLGRYDEALAKYSRSLELRPDDADTLSNRGRAYARLGRYDEALADFNRSLELKPDNPDTIYDLACVFSLWSKPEDSIAYLKRAIELDGKSLEKAKKDEDFDNIRDDPRFKKLIESD